MYVTLSCMLEIPKRVGAAALRLAIVLLLLRLRS